MKKIIKLSMVGAVMVLGFWLRYNKYYEVPVGGASMDEYSYAWVGTSLINEGYPVGISGLPGYRYGAKRYVNPDRVMNSAASGPLPLNYPWFDHPPGLALLSGGWAYLRGARNLEDVRLQLIRQPMVALGTVSVLLVFILGYLNFGYRAGLIASAIYAVQAMAVLGGRMVQGENGVIPLMLLSLIFVSRYLKDGDFKKLMIGGIAAGAAMLFKLSGVAAMVIGVVWIVIFGKKGSRRVDAATILIAAGTVASLFPIYGYFYDWETFKNIIFSNADRFYGIGPDSVYRLLTRTILVSNKSLPDGWIIVGWLSTMMIMNKLKTKKLMIVIPILAYLTIYLFFGSYLYSWYVLPFIPFLAIASGYVIDKTIKKGWLTQGWLLTMLPLGVGISSIVNLGQFQKFSILWRIGIPLVIIMLFGGEFVRNEKIKKWGNRLIGLGLAAGLISSALFVKQLGVDGWYSFSW